LGNAHAYGLEQFSFISGNISPLASFLNVNGQVPLRGLLKGRFF
jgi:hypothetical protein